MSQYISFSEPVAPIPVTDAGLFCVQFDRKLLGYIIGALQVLLDPSTYESDAEQSIIQGHNLIAQIQTGVCPMALPIGSIVAYVTSAVPDDCLDCNGDSYLRVDYPDLYAALHSSYKTDADHFVVPDLRGRAPIGVGTGSGLTARAMNAAVGVETVALSTAEMAPHTHTVPMRNTSVGAGSIAARSSSSSVETTLNTGTLSAASAHQNMQPSRAVGFCIVAR